jgi:heptosyltransferase-3
MTTVVYHTGALGDFITTLPSLLLWKSLVPGRKIILLGTPSIGGIGVRCGCIDTVLDIDNARFASLFSAAPEPRLAEQFEHAGHAILFTSSEQLIAGFRRLGVKNILHQPPFPSERVPASVYHLQLVAPEFRPVPGEIPYPDLSGCFRDCSGVPLPQGLPLVCIHPGSGSPKKNWPFGRFAALAGRFRAAGAAVIWLCGPAEEAIEAAGDDTIVRDRPLEIVGSILSRCSLFVGNDSGIAHLAAAAGCPTVALFGPSDPSVWRMGGGNVIIITGGAECGPCHGTTGAPPACISNCMERIPVVEVWKKCAPLIRSRNGASGGNT